MTFVLMTWLFVVAVAAHNLEEAIWLPEWSQSAGRWHPTVSATEFRLAVVILTAFAALAAWLADLQGKGSIGAYLITGYALAFRDFVPRRFLDAGWLSVRSVALLPASKNLHKSRRLTPIKVHHPDRLASIRKDRSCRVQLGRGLE